MIEGKPNSNLRELCCMALSNKGFAGPPHNLDNISSFCGIEDNGGIYIRFWDMDTVLHYKDKYYLSILAEMKNGTGWLP